MFKMSVNDPAYDDHYDSNKFNTDCVINPKQTFTYIIHEMF